MFNVSGLSHQIQSKRRNHSITKNFEFEESFIHSSISAMSRDIFNLISLVRALFNPILCVCQEAGPNISSDNLSCVLKTQFKNLFPYASSKSSFF